MEKKRKKKKTDDNKINENKSVNMDLQQAKELVREKFAAYSMLSNVYGHWYCKHLTDI